MLPHEFATGASRLDQNLPLRRTIGGSHERWQDRFDRGAVRLEPRRKNQRLPERGGCFIDRETRPVRGEFEERRQALGNKRT